jgi:anti-sigma factor RsiW
MHPYGDGELELSHSLEIEQHLATCAACGKVYQGQEVLRQALVAAPMYYRAPAGLSKKVEAAVRREDRAAGRQATGRRSLPWSWVSAAAAFVVILALGWVLLRGRSFSGQNDLLAQEVLASSMRALMAGPLIDVQSSDQHTVKPWFAGKLDFSPDVQDYAGQGFPLAGGRLDYIGNRPVAALVYHHQQHVINLYTWPAPGSGSTPVQEQDYQGYHILSWTRDGMTNWAVSDMDAAELRQFVQLVQ